MNGITPYPYLDLFLFASALFYGNFFLRNKYPHEAYVIWLVFSFLFSIFLPLAFIADRSTYTDLADVCGSYRATCTSIYSTLTNVNEELELVAIFAAITIAPQILAYFLAGVWGTATAPQYVWAIRQTAVWSFIKFEAGLGGIFMAQALAKFLTGGVVGAADFVPAFNFTATSFVYALWHSQIGDAWDRYYNKHFLGNETKPWYIQAIICFHKKCTRKIPTRPKPTLTRQAIIALLKSDAVWDYITRVRSA